MTLNALRPLALLGCALLLIGACTRDAISDAEPVPTLPATEAAAGGPSTGDVDGFPIDTISHAGSHLLVAIADTPVKRSQGLRGVTDLGELGGMLFVFEGPVTTVFTMEDTVTALDLFLLAEDGTVLEVIPMEPCGGADCRFPPTVVYHFAFEAPQGSVEAAVGDRFILP